MAWILDNQELKIGFWAEFGVIACFRKSPFNFFFFLHLDDWLMARANKTVTFFAIYRIRLFPNTDMEFYVLELELAGIESCFCCSF